jgi:hypothetical protein
MNILAMTDKGVAQRWHAPRRPSLFKTRAGNGMNYSHVCQLTSANPGLMPVSRKK